MWWLLAEATQTPPPSGSGSEGGEIDWGLIADLFAIGVALLAAYFAYRANKISKEAPAKARTEAVREELRNALWNANEGLNELRRLINKGDEVPEVATSLHVAVSAAHRLKDRLPEQQKVLQIEIRLESLVDLWKSTNWEQSQVNWYTTITSIDQINYDNAVRHGDQAHAEHIAPTLERNKDAIGKHTRARDARTVDLKQRQRECKEDIDAYLESLNAAERRSAK